MNLDCGAKKIIINPKDFYKKGDFGEGFYCTARVGVAREWAAAHFSDGYISRYETDTAGLRVVDLTSKPYGIMSWIAVLLENRSFSLSSRKEQREAERIKAENSVDLSSADIIIGWRADNSYFTLAKKCISGEISYEALGKWLKKDTNAVQYAFVSDRAAERLQFTAYVNVNSSIYFPGSINNDEKLRYAFGINANSDECFAKNLAEAFCYAVDGCGITPLAFFEILSSSGFQELGLRGDFSLLFGMSGTELAMLALSEAGIKMPPADIEIDRNSHSYKLGEGAAYYSVAAGVGLKRVFSAIQTLGFDAVKGMSSDRLSLALDSVIKSAPSMARVQAQRKERGLSQRELAERSGVNLRTLQQYELKSKDINKASAKSVLSMARALGCAPEDILEY